MGSRTWVTLAQAGEAAVHVHAAVVGPRDTDLGPLPGAPPSPGPGAARNAGEGNGLGRPLPLPGLLAHACRRGSVCWLRDGTDDSGRPATIAPCFVLNRVLGCGQQRLARSPWPALGTEWTRDTLTEKIWGAPG